ncbi:cupin domain-containing protein [Pseudonocardia sp. KRD291]|uniref:cupin domain-containing protein n=1 Tax=Pseudonocardia sp. KRD291 TaxID=2792007 RepID=UPI001C49ECC6|nr:cupin domain-containing protein [Pseudonocardia sp. KRD291]MBW0103936.1 cupin domain-containing protein [Pseudonocardia sp. KRD291]
MDAAHVERHGHASFPYLLHGGTAPIRAQWYFRTGNRLPVAVQRWSFPPGATEGDHTHPETTGQGTGPLDEIYLLISGRATITLDGDTVELRPGDALLAPAGVRHGVRNDGPDTAEFVLVWGPPGTGLDRTTSRMDALSAAAAAPDAPEGVTP